MTQIRNKPDSSNYIPLFLITLPTISGCASISSEIVCAPEQGGLFSGISQQCNSHEITSVDDGIVYHMPQRPIRLLLTVQEGSSGGSSSATTVVNTTITTPTNSPQRIINEITPPTPSQPPPSQSSRPSAPPGKTVTVSVANNMNEILPDLKRTFLLHYSKNYVGDNNMAVGVNSYGLLSITHSDTINKLNDIVAYAAMDAAAIMTGGGFIPATPPSFSSAKPLPTNDVSSKVTAYQDLAERSITFSDVDTDCKKGTYTWTIDPTTVFSDQDNNDSPIYAAKTVQKCDVAITIQPLFAKSGHEHSSWITPTKPWDHLRVIGNRAKNVADIFQSQYTEQSVPGIFYKQELPYKVTIKSTSDERLAEFTAFSPNQSKVFFAPISETLFTDNTSDITLVNGVVTSLAENTDSELLGLVKLPASAFGAYTNALGQTFSALGSATKGANGLQDAQRQSLFGTAKLQRCQQAIALNDPKGKTGDELATANANIEAACGD